MSGSIFSPDGDRGILIAVLSIHNVYPAIPPKYYTYHIICKDFPFHEPKRCDSKSAKKIWRELSFHGQKICTPRVGHRELHPGPSPNSHNYEKLMKIKFFNLISNFDQATHKN